MADPYRTFPVDWFDRNVKQEPQFDYEVMSKLLQMAIGEKQGPMTASMVNRRMLDYSMGDVFEEEARRQKALNDPELQRMGEQARRDAAEYAAAQGRANPGWEAGTSFDQWLLDMMLPPPDYSRTEGGPNRVTNRPGATQMFTTRKP